MDAQYQVSQDGPGVTTLPREGLSDQDGPAEAAAIAEAMVGRWLDAWNRADAAAFGQVYWPDAEVVNPGGGIESGRAAIEQNVAGFWVGLAQRIQYTASVRKVQQLGPDFLMVDFDIAVDRGPATRTHAKHILAKRDGTWRTLAAQVTFNAQNPPPGDGERHSQT
jgi:uncharacterized protein (TIGR02246 family)